MKINKIKSSNNIISMYGNQTAGERHKQSELIHRSENVKNNSIQNRPAERVSLSGSECLSPKNDQVAFTGNPKLITEIAKEALEVGEKLDAPNWASKMGGAKWFNSVLESVNKNETFYEAFVALVVAGLLKPACVLAMPGAEMEDKQMSATKNAASAIVGFGLSNLILSPCSTAVNKVTKSFNSANPTEYIKDLNYIKKLTSEELTHGCKSTLGDAFKTTYKKVWDVGVSPMKAALTLALTPIIVNALFKKNKEKKAAEKRKPIENPINNMTALNTIRINNSNKTTQPSINNQQVSFSGNKTSNQNDIAFTGGVNQAVELTKEVARKKIPSLGEIKNQYCEILGEPIAKFIGWVSGTKPGQKLVEASAKFEKPSARWSDMASIAITYFYVQNTAKSKKIEEERKLPLMINNVMVTIASSTAAFLIDKFTDKPMEEIFRGYLKNHEADMLSKANKNTEKAFKLLLENPTDKVNIAEMTRHSDELLSGGIENMSENFKNAVKDLKNKDCIKEAIKAGHIIEDDVAKIAASSFEKQASKIFKNMSKTKSLTVFTLTVRFLVTVLMTPVIGRVVAMVNKKLGKGKHAEDKKINNNEIPPACSENIGMKDFMNSLGQNQAPKNTVSLTQQAPSPEIKHDDDDDDDKHEKDND